jgi:hypothetical protein
LVMPTEWSLHYESWIIGDGEPNRSVGEVFDWFAVEFVSVEGLAKTEAQSKSALPVADFAYQVVAELVFLSEEACVIDFGLRATARADNLRPACKQGDYVSGIVYISLPAYVMTVPDALFKTLEHRWRVNRISADLTPYTLERVAPDGRRILEGMRDASRSQFREVDSTQTVSTHNYVLHCSEVT